MFLITLIEIYTFHNRIILFETTHISCLSIKHYTFKIKIHFRLNFFIGGIIILFTLAFSDTILRNKYVPPSNFL